MPFRRSKSNPIDYLIAAAVHVCDTKAVEYSADFRGFVTTALMPLEPTTHAQTMAKSDPNAFQRAASAAISEAARLALARGDPAAVPAVVSIGVSLAMRFTMYLMILHDEEE